MKMSAKTVALSAGAAMMASLWAIAPASAQSSAGTTASPINRTSLVPSADGPVGPGISRMPLVSRSVFERAAEAATGAKLTGTPGAVTSSEEGGKAALAPEAWGSSTAPYTTARVAVQVLGTSSQASQTPVNSYPFRATGKLWARWGTNWYICSASLVKKGVLITAAHCIFNYGQKANGWAQEVRWYPANRSSSGGDYGVYSHRQLRIPTPYYNGNDTCTQTGVVCNNDIATVVLNIRDGKYPGEIVGWYGYGWNGYSYKASSFLGDKTTVQITQLGYPKAFDSGYQMIRTDAVGWYHTSGDLKNTQIGSAQTGGSSGGPWLVNFGTRPVVDTSAASLGSHANSNVVVGVTSYGSTTVGFNRQGSSFFGQNKEFPNSAYGSYGAGNIGKIMLDTCTAQPSYC